MYFSRKKGGGGGTGTSLAREGGKVVEPLNSLYRVFLMFFYYKFSIFQYNHPSRELCFSIKFMYVNVRESHRVKPHKIF